MKSWKKFNKLDMLGFHDLHTKADNLYREDPEEAIRILQYGYEHATKQNERRWIVVFSYFIGYVMTNAEYDYVTLHNHTVRSAEEARQPGYQPHKEHICVHKNLVHTYMVRDPAGHRVNIQQTLDYMQHEITPDMRCYYCLQGLKSVFYQQTEQFSEAYEISIKQLADARKLDEPQRLTPLVTAYYQLCNISFKQKNMKQLAKFAKAGSELTQDSDTYDRTYIIFLMWLALALYSMNHKEMAVDVYHVAQRRRRVLSRSPGNDYYGVAYEYHLLRKAYDRSLAMVDKQLANLAGKGYLYFDIACHLRRVNVLKQMGQLTEDDIIQARHTAEQLSDPLPYLEQLNALLD